MRRSDFTLRRRFKAPPPPARTFSTEEKVRAIDMAMGVRGVDSTRIDEEGWVTQTYSNGTVERWHDSSIPAGRVAPRRPVDVVRRHHNLYFDNEVGVHRTVDGTGTRPAVSASAITMAERRLSLAMSQASRLDGGYPITFYDLVPMQWFKFEGMKFQKVGEDTARLPGPRRPLARFAPETSVVACRKPFMHDRHFWEGVRTVMDSWFFWLCIACILSGISWVHR